MEKNIRLFEIITLRRSKNKPSANKILLQWLVFFLKLKKFPRVLASVLFPHKNPHRTLSVLEKKTSHYKKSFICTLYDLLNT